jgi:hypothetical protein
MRHEPIPPAKIERIKEVYTKEVLTKEISVADMASRFGIDVNNIKYHLRKAHIWIPAGVPK